MGIQKFGKGEIIKDDSRKTASSWDDNDEKELDKENDEDE